VPWSLDTIGWNNPPSAAMRERIVIRTNAGDILPTRVTDRAGAGVDDAGGVGQGATARDSPYPARDERCPRARSTRSGGEGGPRQGIAGGRIIAFVVASPNGRRGREA